MFSQNVCTIYLIPYVHFIYKNTPACYKMSNDIVEQAYIFAHILIPELSSCRGAGNVVNGAKGPRQNGLLR